MNYSVGIDLGSTTTKAVILDEAGKVLGRGITNSRSNYGVACDVAVSEALVDARFTLISSGLADAGLSEEARAEALAGLELKFREQQYRSQLRALGKFLHAYGSTLKVEDAVRKTQEELRAAAADYRRWRDS